jgi:hypothetical protein
MASVVLLPGVEPGFNLEDIANHIVKAGVVLVVVWRFVPPMRQLLALPRDDDYDDGAGEPEDAAPLEGAVADQSLQP